MLRSALRFVLAAVITTLVWIAISPLYNSLLAMSSQPLLRIDPRLRGVEAGGADNRIFARGGTSRPDLPRVLIPAGELTYNVILFAGLFASTAGALRGGGWRRLGIAIAILIVTHLLAVVITIESTYATKLGAWSDRHYSGALQDFWGAAEYAYRLAGMFGIAFALWWVSVPAEVQRDRARSAA